MSYQIPQRDTSPHPTFRLHTPAVDFIENRLPEYHEAFDVRRVRYDASQGQFVALIPAPSQSLMVPDASPPTQPRPAPAPVADMKFWDEIFPDAMELLNNETPTQSKYSEEWGIRHLTKWQEVEAKLEKARQVYGFETGSQNVGKVRRKVRSLMDDHHVIAQQATKLVPNSEIATPIVGVINLMVDAYSKASQVRQEVNSSLEDLPDSFAKMDMYLQSYPKDANIVKASTNLVLAIFKAIENSIKFYTSVQAKRAGVAILTGPQYQAILVKSLTEMKTCCSELENQARMSFDHRMMGDNDRMFRDLSTIMQRNTVTNMGLGAILREQQAQTAGVLWMQDMFNCVLSILSDRERNWQPYSPVPSRPVTPQSIQMPELTPRELWSRLGIPNFDEIDLQHMASRAEEMFHQDQGRAQQVVTTQLFRNWLGNPNSSKLLVHGDFRTAGDVSPFSTLCAVLAHTFRESGRYISLVFFCGRHLAWDEHQGGAVMMRSLIAQLLRQFPGQYFQPESQMFIQNMDLRSVESLCSLFTHLIGQIPPRTPVICIIDSVNLYETDDYLDDLASVILSLVSLVDDGSRGGRPPLKLLLTSPRPTVEVRRIFDLDPQGLLHTESLPWIGSNLGVGGLQERLASGI
ncbi:hypothetical protein MRS44_004267 [Fusarium solani]|uniref:uncharacterized protein n=1 Tax=Fusarium solani TaxID=169388 RepID=UPI0032C444B5|nr:hypothetical protein MRS44_004267 [Fusarium solani]